MMKPNFLGIRAHGPICAGVLLSIVGAAGAQAEQGQSPFAQLRDELNAASIDEPARDAAGTSSRAEVILSGDALPGLAAAVQPDLMVSSAYSARGYVPIWGGTDGANARAAALIDAIGDADAHALPRAKYAADRLESLMSGPWTVAAEMAFTRTFLDFARDLGSGLLEPRRVDRDIDVEPTRPNPGTLLSGLAASAEPAAFMERLAPEGDDYRRLLQVYAELRILAQDPMAWGKAVGKGPTLRPGDRSARVAQLRDRLRLMGDYRGGPTPAIEDGMVVAANDVTTDVDYSSTPDTRYFDGQLGDAVKRFQRRHGLNDDGIVGPATLETLNATPAERARQAAVNLERVRWNNGRMTGTRIVANLPDYRVKMFDGGEVVFESRVVIGKYKHQTVEFSDQMDHMVVNPTWYIPQSIIKNEIAPALAADPDYLAKKNMEYRGNGIVQRPGRGNALGRVKFMFPNDHAIYLHDTPSRSLFRRDNRAYSHGCVRVEKPIEFAHILLNGQVSNPEASFNRWLKRGREAYVTLDRKIPVHLVYRTTWIDDAGDAQFRTDVYGRDELVAEALGDAGVAMPGV